MINKRLIKLVPESKKSVAAAVGLQWVSLVANVVVVLIISGLLQQIYQETTTGITGLIAGIAILTLILVRYICIRAAASQGAKASTGVKMKLRKLIFEKLLSLGEKYKEIVSTGEIVQVAVEGVEQLEAYFGSYLPQLFYSILAPLTLFAVMCFINVPVGALLFACVPLIPIVIFVVQLTAKKLLKKYWGEYTTLGDSFLENLQGLTTMKIFQTDGLKHKEMNGQSEKFRKITMRVLMMQLNSITLMDIIAFGGAALGVICGAIQFSQGRISLAGGLAIILLSAEFFIPMRLLGSFFHVAMNGVAASDKIFRLLDMEECHRQNEVDFPKRLEIKGENLKFSYEKNRQIINEISFEIPEKGLTAIVGESGCGKSTIAAILMGKQKKFTGSLTIGGVDIEKIGEKAHLNSMVYLGFESYLFKGSVRENLLVACSGATDLQLWQVLKKVRLEKFLKSEKGLDTKLLEKASNFSGGQRQRLALARAILKDSPIYIFDEATSNIDSESEDDIIKLIYSLSKNKMVILITHRLANGSKADKIYVMSAGMVKESGTHNQLLQAEGLYTRLWQGQESLKNFAKERTA